MSEKPILFSTPMVQAILDGRKTQTRRVMKPQPDMKKMRWNGQRWEMHLGYPLGHDVPLSPYGRPGDVLWVREAFKYLDSERTKVCYRATPDTCDDGTFIRLGHWRPSIYMPKWACRIWLEILDVRIEPLQDITADDVLAEGSQLGEFSKLWDNINGKRGFGWDTNPWVWVVTFKMTEGAPDQFHQIAAQRNETADQKSPKLA